METETPEAPEVEAQTGSHSGKQSGGACEMN